MVELLFSKKILFMNILQLPEVLEEFDLEEMERQRMQLLPNEGNPIETQETDD